MAKKQTDTKTLDLIREINRQKEEISKAEKPNWVTNCSFGYIEDSPNRINLHVESNLRNLISIGAFLLDKERSYKEAGEKLGVEADKFRWGGFSTDDWFEDLRTRINKIQIASKRKKLEALEARLNLIISPELRAEMELEAIQNELT